MASPHRARPPPPRVLLEGHVGLGLWPFLTTPDDGPLVNPLVEKRLMGEGECLGWQTPSQLLLDGTPPSPPPPRVHEERCLTSTNPYSVNLEGGVPAPRWIAVTAALSTRFRAYRGPMRWCSVQEKADPISDACFFSCSLIGRDQIGSSSIWLFQNRIERLIQIGRFANSHSLPYPGQQSSP